MSRSRKWKRTQICKGVQLNCYVKGWRKCRNSKNGSKASRDAWLILIQIQSKRGWTLLDDENLADENLRLP